MSGVTISAREEASLIGAIGRCQDEVKIQTSHGTYLGKNVPGSENSKYKCPEAEQCLMLDQRCWRK